MKLLGAGGRLPVRPPAGDLSHVAGPGPFGFGRRTNVEVWKCGSLAETASIPPHLTPVLRPKIGYGFTVRSQVARQLFGFEMSSVVLQVTILAVCEELTLDAVTVKPAVDEFAGTVRM